MKIKLPFGLRDGKLLHVSEVESGLKCECYCPACNYPLEAKKGEINSHHFAHYRTAECSKAVETALHIFAKNIIAHHKRIFLPSLYYYYNPSSELLDVAGDEEDYEMHHNGKDLLFDGGEIIFDDVYLEKRLDDIIPDIVLKKGKQELIIEIAVHHALDKKKREKIVRLGISTLEINLRNLLKQEFNEAEVEKTIIADTVWKKWIFNANTGSIKSDLIAISEKKLLTKMKEDTVINSCPLQHRVRGIEAAECLYTCKYCIPPENAVRNQDYDFIDPCDYFYCWGRSIEKGAKIIERFRRAMGSSAYRQQEPDLSKSLP